MMLFTRSTFIGVYLPPVGKQIFYAAVDDDLKPMALGDGRLNDVLAFLGGQRQAVTAVNAPPRLNLGLMEDSAYLAGLEPPPEKNAGSNMRVAEYLLGERGLPIYQTPAVEKSAKPWMRAGFQLWRRLEEIGFQPFPSDGDGSQAEEEGRYLIEGSPDISFQVWLGKVPLEANTLEGRIQRQLVLYDLGMDIPDAMMFFEEITRYRLLQGELPQEPVYLYGEIQALANAYLAWAVMRRRERVEYVGDQQEGRIVMPRNGKE